MLDRRETLPISFDPSEAEPEKITKQTEPVCVRDVSWHSQVCGSDGLIALVPI